MLKSAVGTGLDLSLHSTIPQAKNKEKPHQRRDVRRTPKEEVEGIDGVGEVEFAVVVGIDGIHARRIRKFDR